MKESDWRSRLVKGFTQVYKDQGVIWVNDVRYKAGWPDIYIIANGVSRHYELKISKLDTPINPLEEMTGLQVAMCKRIAIAGCHVSCVVYVPFHKSVTIYNFNRAQMYNVQHDLFYYRWINGYLI